MSDEIQEGNRLIAEFMGDNVNYEYNRQSPSNKTVKKILRYHTSWDWLMPVIKKIKDWVPVNNMGISLYQPINKELQLLDIETTFNAVIKFITWYNQTTKTKTNG